MTRRQVTTAALAVTATLATLWGAAPAAAALPPVPPQGVKMIGSSPYGHAYVINDVAAHPAHAWYAAGPGSTDSTGYVDYVIRTGTGRYTVWLPGLGANGVAVITEANGAYCGVTAVRAIEDRDVPGTDVEVACFSTGSLTLTASPTLGGTPAGVAANATFALTYAHLGLTAPGQPPPPPGAPSAYLRATRPTAPFYQPDLAFQYNATGARNTVERVGTGEYLVRLPGLDARAGAATVTAFGPGNHRCTARDHAGSGGLVVVACRTPDGVPTDAPFALLRDGTTAG